VENGVVDPPRPGTVLDRRTLNRTLLARQGLLRPLEMTTPEAIEHLVGLQAQVPVDPFISLRARLRDFDPLEIDALISERRAVRANLLRGTIHLVTAADALRMRGAIQGVLARSFASSAFSKRLEGMDVPELLAAAAALLEERPRTTAELGAALAERWPDRDKDSMAYAVRYLVPLIHVPPRGLWLRSAATRLTTMRQWLGPEPEAMTLDELVVRYLRAFGPATAADIRTWSWLTGLRAVIDRLRPQLTSYRDEGGRELLDVSDGPFAEPDTPAPIFFLGEYDNVFLSHAERSRITGDQAWGAAYARRRAFFVDGFLAGSWQVGQTGSTATLRLDPVVTIQPTATEALLAAAESMLAFLTPSATSRLVVLPSNRAA
jgi:hypothetical protein